MSERSYGLVFSSPDARDYQAQDYHSAPALAAILPPLLDLRRAMPPVTNQYSEGACVGHALAGAEGYEQRTQPAPGANAPDFEILSPRHAYWGARQLQPVAGDGAYLPAALKWAQRRGLLTSAVAPFVAGQRDWAPPANWEADAARNRVDMYGRVSLDFDSLARALYDFGPLFAEIMADDGFGQGRGQWGGAEGGGHAVVMCGYDKARGLLLFRNSWGEGWGEGGYAWYPLSGNLRAAFWTTTNRKPGAAWIPWHERIWPGWFLEA